jgi:hypothetical protein
VFRELDLVTRSINVCGFQPEDGWMDGFEALYFLSRLCQWCTTPFHVSIIDVWIGGKIVLVAYGPRALWCVLVLSGVKSFVPVSCFASRCVNICDIQIYVVIVSDVQFHCSYQ